MFGLRRLDLPRALRVFALGLLVIGLVMKPVLATVCDIEDTRPAMTGEHQPVATAAQDMDSAGQECCPAQSCNECCAHTAAMTAALNVVMTSRIVTSPLSTLSVDFTPTAYPVAVRPPIVA